MRHHEHFASAGAICCLSTNSLSVLNADRLTFPPASGGDCSDGCKVTIEVTSSPTATQRAARPYFRGLEAMVMASFGPSDILLFNQLTKNVLGRVSPELAEDEEYWKTIIFPLMVGTMGPVMGVTQLHCACLVENNNGQGIVLAGRSGAGKSTLSFALARMGFEFLSDDWTYLSHKDGRLSAWGMPIPAKLLPDAVRFFPELQNSAPVMWLNGEAAFQADPTLLCGAQRTLHCDPRQVFILERHDGPECEFIPCDKERVREWFEKGVQQLPASLQHFREEQLRTIELLAECECWILRHAGPPDHVAAELARFCGAPRRDARKPIAVPAHMDARVPDLLRRFSPTPLQCDTNLRGAFINVETNSPWLIENLCRQPAPERSAARSSGARWRIVVEDDAPLFPALLPRVSGKEETLPWISFAGGGFLAFDEENDIGIGFLADSMLRQDRFLDDFLLPGMSHLMGNVPCTTEAA